VLITVIIPAYNEQDRLGTMLTEAVEYLETEYPPSTEPMLRPNPTAALQRKGSSKRRPASNGSHVPPPPDGPRGWEILLVSDGSTDRTVQTGLEFARAQKPETAAAIRVISLQENRGKGGAVTHGMRHVRGQYAIFADADGASKFSDLAKLVRACQRVEDGQGRGVAVGSRAHLVGSEAVVKVRCVYRHSTSASGRTGRR
jgi:dolichyl-phosphate beta-glucosyltransferase